MTLKQQVEQTLKTQPDTRNSDITLMIAIWKKYYGVGEYVELKKLYDLPREDNIKRIRAKFCEEKKEWAYPTSLEVARKRGIKENEWRLFLGYPLKEQTIHLFN